MSRHLIGWLVFAVFWVIGCATGHSLAAIGWLNTSWAMAFGVAWAFACWHLRLAVLHAMGAS
mgnify:CR=1 FL=1